MPGLQKHEFVCIMANSLRDITEYKKKKRLHFTISRFSLNKVKEIHKIYLVVQNKQNKSLVIFLCFLSFWFEYILSLFLPQRYVGGGS